MMNILKQYKDVLQLPPPNVNTKIKHIFIGLKMLLVVSWVIAIDLRVYFLSRRR